MNDERLHRYYHREEDFLDQYYSLAPAAAAAVNNQWNPDADCDDRKRQQHQYFIKSNDMTWLVFDGAAVYHDPDGFSSVVIVLRSSTRTVSVRVRPDGGSYAAMIEVDKAP